MVIHKYSLALVEEQNISTYAGAELLDVQFQHGILCVWARIDLEANPVSRRISLRGTGYSAPEGEHIGTVQQAGG